MRNESSIFFCVESGACQIVRVRRSRRSKRGVVLILVLACLSIVTALVLTSVQFAVRSRRETRVERDRIQTELLCDAGVYRALQRLRSSKDYVGEQWQPQGDWLDGGSAKVDIRVTRFESPSDDPSRNASSQLQVDIVALLSSLDANVNPALSVQRSRSLQIVVPTKLISEN